MKIVLTGSSSGIGEFLAGALARAGHDVCGLARSQSEGFGFRCDVSDWEAVQSCGEKIAAKWNTVDALICCAGIQGPIGAAMEIDPPAWRQTLAMNLDGTFFPIRALHLLLKKSARRAKVICFSGGGATAPRANFTAYGVAKTGVVRLVETLAAEWRGEARDINAIAPGAIFTRMTEQVLASGEALAGADEFSSAAKLPRDNSAKLDRVLGLVEFLISQASDGISGRLISAQWDAWQDLPARKVELMDSDIYTLRRIMPADRGKNWTS